MSRNKTVATCVLVLVGLASTSCSDSDGGSCQDGNEMCDGNTVMQCDSGDWTVKKNCEDTGRICERVSATDADCQ